MPGSSKAFNAFDQSGEIWPRGYKTFSMLNSAAYEIFAAHKCYNVNNGWHYNIYEREK